MSVSVMVQERQLVTAERTIHRCPDRRLCLTVSEHLSSSAFHLTARTDQPPPAVLSYTSENNFQFHFRF